MHTLTFSRLAVKAPDAYPSSEAARLRRLRPDLAALVDAHARAAARYSGRSCWGGHAHFLKQLEQACGLLARESDRNAEEFRRAAMEFRRRVGIVAAGTEGHR